MIDKEIVALYVRVSTQEQAREGYSIEEQKDKLIKYAEAHGWIIYNTKSIIVALTIITCFWDTWRLISLLFLY